MTISFKSYLKKSRAVLLEALPEHLSHIPDSWDHHSEVSDETKEKMYHAMGGTGKDFTTFPLPEENSGDLDADVAEHLVNHGYDYDHKKGLAFKKITTKGDPTKNEAPREKIVSEKIGKVLDKTGASDDVKKAYMNDPSRASSKSQGDGSDLIVCVGHGARHVAGMTSGTSWHNQSCMNLETGAYRHKVEEDSRHGSHVFMLARKDDQGAIKYGEPDNPIARIAGKPYHSEDGDTIIRPEDKTFGSGSSRFTKAVAKWCIDKYPAKSGVDYEKNRDVYDDTRNSTYRHISNSDIDNTIKNHTPIVNIMGSAVDHDTINYAFGAFKKHIENFPEMSGEGDSPRKMETRHFVSNMASIGNLSAGHVSKLVSMANGTPTLQSFLAREHGDKFSTSAINAHIASGAQIPHRMMMNSKLPQSAIDDIHPGDYHYLNRAHIKPEHIDKLVNMHADSRNNLTPTSLERLSDRLTKEHIDKLVSNPKLMDYATRTVINSPHFSQAHHDELMRDPREPGTGLATKGGQYIDKVLGQSKFATLAEAKSLGRASAMKQLVSNTNISPEEQKKVKDHLISVCKSSSIFPAHIAEHMNDADYDKLASIGHHGVFHNEEHGMKLHNAYRRLITKTDKEISDHIDKETDDNPEYKSTEDDHLYKLKDKLHNHIARFASALDTHLDTHGITDEGNVASHHAVDHVDNHLYKLKHLLNYSPDEDYDDGEHHEEHIEPLHDKIMSARDYYEYN